MASPLGNALRYSHLRRNERFLYVYIIFSPIVDLITGVMIHRFHFSEGGLGTPSQLFRIAFIPLLFITLPRKQSILSLIILTWLLIVEGFGFFSIVRISQIVSGFNYSIKLFFSVILLLSANSAIRKGLQMQQLTNWYLLSATLYALGVVIPTILGIGVTNYGEGTFGQKGLFASGNALSIYMGVACIFAALVRHKSPYDWGRFLIILSALLLAGTKTGLVFLSVLGLILIAKQSFWKQILIAITLGSVIVVFWQSIADIFSTIFDVVLYLWEKRDDNLTFFVSGRNKYVIDAFAELWGSNYLLIRLIIGGGAFVSFRNDITNNMSFDTLETDPFDILFMYGVIGLTVYIIIAISFIRQGLKCHNSISLLIILFVGHSVFAGHVLFEGIPMITGVVLYLCAKYHSE